jgi:hypothetical protein
VVAYPSACLRQAFAPDARGYRIAAALLILAGLGCVEVESLVISAGAPVTGAVRGRITDCGIPTVGVRLVFRVQQDGPEQARPVDTRIGPVTTGKDGSYVVEIGPAFAVPGPATVQLNVAGAETGSALAAGTLRFTLGVPARDTLQLDADLGAANQRC